MEFKLNKRKVLVLIGGNSNEHDVSIISGINVYNNIPKKYDKEIIYLNKKNVFFEIEKEFEKRKISFPYEVKILNKIENTIEFIRKFDIVFPVLHGKFGEDGQIQKIFEKNNIKYIGCDSYSSKICFDKDLTKKNLKKHNINMAKTITLELDEKCHIKDLNIENLQDLNVKIEENLKYPVFVKPARSGSSVGVTKVINFEELKNAIKIAFNEDNKILIEEMIIGKEIECAILENNDKIITSRVGEIKPAEDFYTFDSKYVDKKEQGFLFNPNNDKKIEIQEKEIQKIAKIIFKKLGCKDLSRVDFFLTENGYVFNEINTMPGFTTISMYPKLLIETGYKYEEIIEILIENQFD